MSLSYYIHNHYNVFNKKKLGQGNVERTGRQEEQKAGGQAGYKISEILNALYFNNNCK